MAANDATGIVFEGMTEFEGAMTQLAIELPEKAVRRGLRDGGRVIQAAITEAAPVRPDLPSGTALPPGALKADIELHVVKERNEESSFSAYIEPGKYTRYAARLVEYGHEMVIGGRKGKGRKAVGQVAAHPFFRPAFDASEGEAMAATEATILAEIENEAVRLGFTG